MLVENSLLNGGIALVFTIEEALRNSIHAVIITTGATFGGIVRVTIAGPVHLILGVGKAAGIVVAEVQHSSVDTHAGSAGRR